VSQIVDLTRTGLARGALIGWNGFVAAFFKPRQEVAVSPRDRPSVAYVIAIAAGCVALGVLTASPGAEVRAHAAASAPTPPHHLVARRLRGRRGAVARGTIVSSSALFPDRVFANGADGFSLANRGSAQYPARSVDGGRTWRIDGPQVHIDAADGPEAVGYVGVANSRTFFAYGSSVVDVTTNSGHTWWETFLGELVVAVVPGPRNDLVAYVQQQAGTGRANPAVTWQYVSADGGRHWSYSTSLGG
jgi:hypothetical protein